MVGITADGWNTSFSGELEKLTCPRHRESGTHDPKSPDRCADSRGHRVPKQARTHPRRTRTRTGRPNPTREPHRRTSPREIPAPHGPTKPNPFHMKRRTREPREASTTNSPRATPLKNPTPFRPARNRRPESSRAGTRSHPHPREIPPPTGPRARGRAGPESHLGWEIDPSSNPVLAA